MRPIIITTKTEKKSHIILSDNAFRTLRKVIKKNYTDKKIAVITDKNLAKIHEKTIKENLGNSLIIKLKPGETTKTRETKAMIEDILLEKNFNRNAVLISIGGGVIGDITGFAAGTFMRGIPFIQIPTSLLAMVDASIGGKTGIDTKQGKNLIGVFHQPDAVIIDTNFLKTLPEEEFCNGLSEIIKISYIKDRKLFLTIEKNIDKIMKKDKKLLNILIEKSIINKKQVIEKDPGEKGYRQILNFGHTIAHGIEKASNYQIKHGFAVSIGMAIEGEIAVKLGILGQHHLERIKNLLLKMSLPITIPKNVSMTKIFEAMTHDKKNSNEQIKCVLLEKIGAVYINNNQYSFPVDKGIIMESLSKNIQK